MTQTPDPIEANYPDPVLPRSAIPGIVWPPVPNAAASRLLALLHQLNHSQWWDTGTLRDMQLRQLHGLLSHAYQTVPHYQQSLDQAGFNPAQPLTEQVFSALPILTRRDLQLAPARITSDAVPRPHGQTATISTSGSTGRPVQVTRTELSRLIGHALILREHAWHHRDLSAGIAVIRFVEDRDAARPPDGLHQQGWDSYSHRVYPTGPCALLSIGSPVGDQLAWLRRENPTYLMTYPTNLRALVERMHAESVHLDALKGVQTISETLDSETRNLAREVLGVPVVDSYGATEMGIIASQCPRFDHYHTHAEAVYAEVLRPDGSPCAPGEAGRVVVTDLHNFAMPLIRYAIGDFAEVGEPCACGRGLPVIRRILGRVRNMLTLPTGEQVWPRLRNQMFAAAAGAPIEQIQVVQTALSTIEVRLVCHPLSREQEDSIAHLLAEAVAHPFTFTFSYKKEIPRSRSGKFEEFLSEL